MSLKYLRYVEGSDAIINNNFDYELRDVFRKDVEFRERLLGAYNLDKQQGVFSQFATHFLNEICEHLEDKHPGILEFLDKYYKVIDRKVPEGLLFNSYPSIFFPLIYGESIPKKIESGGDGFSFKRWYGSKKDLISTNLSDKTINDPKNTVLAYKSSFLYESNDKSEIYDLSFTSKTGIKVIIEGLFKPEILNPFIQFNLKNTSAIPHLLLHIEKIKTNLKPYSEDLKSRSTMVFILILYFHFKIGISNIDFINTFLRLLTFYSNIDNHIKNNIINLLNKQPGGNGNQIIISLYKNRINYLEKDINQIYDLIKIYLIDKTPKIYYEEVKVGEGSHWQDLLPVDHKSLNYFPSKDREKMKTDYIDKSVAEFYDILMGNESDLEEI